jgi:hypothetical protein
VGCFSLGVIKLMFQELEKEPTMRKIGNSDFSTKPTNFYNLDVIISVGYRVKSHRGVHFRKWATALIKEYLIKGSPLKLVKPICSFFEFTRL